MPNTTDRPSLTMTLEERYKTQRVGGAFDIHRTIDNIKTGTIIDATSINGAQFQSPNGFESKVLQGQTQLKDAQGSSSKQLSIYLKGFDNRRYHR